MKQKRKKGAGRPRKHERNLAVIRMIIDQESKKPEEKLTRKQIAQNFGVDRSRIPHILNENWSAYLEMLKK